MNDQERDELTERANKLRIELKAWEKEFAAVNQGKKAAREDIKNNPDIAAKYKEYNKSRDILSGKVEKRVPKISRQTPQKRKLDDDAGHGASKRQQMSRTPSKTPTKGSLQPWEVDPYESPSTIRNLFTPSRKALGPTPQKDGVVMGIFDLLQEHDSPSKIENAKTQSKDITVLKSTPRKGNEGIYDTLKHSRTPASAGKRRMLDAFSTPLKTRGLNGEGGQTPSSVSKLHFNTPSFLRRDSQRINLPPTNEHAEGPELSPQMVRVPRKPLVRGLSSILAGLRKIEEDAADEDLELLREMEAEEAAKRIPTKSAPTKEAVLVADSRPGFPLGAFDDEALYDSQPDEQDKGLGPDGQPLKIYKKKGQKRTTRRVNMKPTRSKPQIQPEAPKDDDSDDELATDSRDIPETQEDQMEGFTDARNFDSDTQSEYTASEGGTRYKRPNQSKKSKSANKDGRVKTAARKVGALAHQNFKRLKLRNSGAKGGAAHNSRFRRRK